MSMLDDSPTRLSGEQRMALIACPHGFIWQHPLEEETADVCPGSEEITVVKIGRAWVQLLPLAQTGGS